MSKYKSLTGLEHFARLNQAVYLHKASVAKTGTSQAPDLVLLLGWMDAKPRHLAKYAASYEKLYPSANIIAITSSAIDIAIRSRSANFSRIKPALDILYTLPADAKLLVHFFSNGGAYTNTLISKAYKEKMGRPLPISAMILDSNPGHPSYEATVRAFSVGLPKNVFVQVLGAVILRLIWWLTILASIVAGKDNVVEVARRELNDKALFDLDTPRLYIYSVADEMVEWQHVEEHAKEAKQLGYTVALEKYQESGHATHMLTDPERYWAAVQRLWNAQ